MKPLKLTLLLSLYFICSIVSAQKSNILLKREFWKTNPTIEQVEEKIKEGNSATKLNRSGFDAVVYALLEDANENVIKHLLTKDGNDVNKLTHDKRTYIFWAAYKGNIELVKHLIKNNARLDLRDSHNFSPLTFAAVAGQKNTDIYDLFIKNGIDVKNDLDENGANALLLLIPHLNDFTLVNYFISKGLPLESIDNDGNGVFNYTAKKGNKTMLELLIKKGVSYKKNNKNGGNALLLATQGSRNGYNSLVFFKYLESLSINPNTTNKKGKTPLHNLAYGNRDIAVFNYFINKDIDINQIDSRGNNPLINASGRNSLDVVRLLASKTKNINQTNKEGKSALTNALRNKLEIIKLLLEKGSDISVIDAKGNNLNYYLFRTFNSKKEKEFKQKLELLKAKGLAINKSQKNGNTLFHLAVEKQSIGMLNFIKKYKIDINAKNKKGLTPLQQAVLIAKNDRIIKYLITEGANKTIKTAFDESLYDLAKENEVLRNTDIGFLK